MNKKADLNMIGAAIIMLLIIAISAYIIYTKYFGVAKTVDSPLDDEKIALCTNSYNLKKMTNPDFQITDYDQDGIPDECDVCLGKGTTDEITKNCQQLTKAEKKAKSNKDVLAAAESSFNEVCTFRGGGDLKPAGSVVLYGGKPEQKVTVKFPTCCFGSCMPGAAAAK